MLENGKSEFIDYASSYDKKVKTVQEMYIPQEGDELKSLDERYAIVVNGGTTKRIAAKDYMTKMIQEGFIANLIDRRKKRKAEKESEKNGEKAEPEKPADEKSESPKLTVSDDAIKDINDTTTKLEKLTNQTIEATGKRKYDDADKYATEEEKTAADLRKRYPNDGSGRVDAALQHASFKDGSAHKLIDKARKEYPAPKPAEPEKKAEAPKTEEKTGPKHAGAPGKQANDGKPKKWDVIEDDNDDEKKTDEKRTTFHYKDKLTKKGTENFKLAPKQKVNPPVELKGYVPHTEPSEGMKPAVFDPNKKGYEPPKQTQAKEAIFDPHDGETKKDSK